jgi:hypothetical protein
MALLAIWPLKCLEMIVPLRFKRSDQAQSLEQSDYQRIPNMDEMAILRLAKVQELAYHDLQARWKLYQRQLPLL